MGIWARHSWQLFWRHDPQARHTEGTYEGLNLLNLPAHGANPRDHQGEPNNNASNKLAHVGVPVSGNGRNKYEEKECRNRHCVAVKGA